MKASGLTCEKARGLKRYSRGLRSHNLEGIQGNLPADLRASQERQEATRATLGTQMLAEVILGSLVY